MGIAVQTGLVEVKGLLVFPLLHIHNIVRIHLPHLNNIYFQKVSAESMFKSGEIQHFWNELMEIY